MSLVEIITMGKKNSRIGREPKYFHVQIDIITPNRVGNYITKTKQNIERNVCVTIVTRHGLMLSKCATQLWLLVINIEPCKVFFPNGESNPMECQILEVHVVLPRTHIIGDREIQTWSKYDIILGTLWLVWASWCASHVRALTKSPAPLRKL